MLNYSNGKKMPCLQEDVSITTYQVKLLVQLITENDKHIITN